MGGFGSGGYHGCKQATVEDCLTAVIGFIAKLGFLAEGVTGTLRWSCSGEPRGPVSVIGGTNMIVFCYSHTEMGGEPKSIQQPVHIERTVCNFGGSRPWFTCPSCQSRVGVLVCAGKLFKGR